MRRFCWRRKALCPCRLQCFISSSHLQDSCISSGILLDNGDDDSYDPPTVQETVLLLLELSYSCHISYSFCKNIISTNNVFFFLKIGFWNHLPHFNIPCTGKSVSTKVASLGTTYDVTSVADCISF